MSHSFHPTDRTVDEIEDEIEEVDDPEDAEAILELEQAGNERVTAIEAIEARLDDLEPEEKPEGSTDQDGTERITVRNYKHEAAKVAGYSFDAGEAKRIPNTHQVQLALERGQLQFVTN